MVQFPPTASVVTYSIVAGNTYDAFVIRNFTGEIRVNSELDYENITSYSLDVRAFDGIYEDYAKVIINIENLNDNPPVFLANYTKTIEEEKLYEGCIVKVCAKILVFLRYCSFFSIEAYDQLAPISWLTDRPLTVEQCL